MKKNYLKPDAEFIAFYSDEDIAKIMGQNFLRVFRANQA